MGTGRLAWMGFWAIVAAGAIAWPGLAAKPAPPKLTPLKFTCPNQVEPLMTELLRDLPGYMNRIYRRVVQPRTGAESYAIVASLPEFTPLPVNSSEYRNPTDPNLHQVFFTVLERQYQRQRVTETQQHHWLFLVQTQTGWQVALMFSRIGDYPTTGRPSTPTRDSQDGVAAQAIRAWLRDCQLGRVRR